MAQTVIVEVDEPDLVIVETDPSPSTLEIEEVVEVIDVSDPLMGPQGAAGPPGAPGVGGAGAGYIHNQTVPESVWVINHPLTFPAVVTVDSARRVVYGDVSYPNAQTVRVEFSAPFGGYAYLT